MLFHSHVFLVFFFLFLGGLWFFRGEARIIYTAVASFVFYGWWYPPYLFVLIFVILFAHFGAKHASPSKIGFGAIVALGLLPLAVFKYTGFVLENFTDLTGIAVHFRPDWTLPLGISFISFTAIAYIADTRKGDITAEPRFWHTALFISFFPQLIAGPILRAHELMPQITRIRIDLPRVKFALFLFAIGALKKVGVADQLAPVVDGIYNGEAIVTLPEAVLAFYAFAIQIYCDFSGYTDMALATAFALNVALPPNFARPYMARSIREFWQCWHMTLSRWLRDYLFIPLGGSRHGIPRTAYAIMITMFLGGLWHGAAWTFVIWGLMHGALVTFEHLMSHLKVRADWLPTWARRLLIFHFVAVAWVVFRAPSLERAGDIFSGLFIPGNYAVVFDQPLVPILMALVMLLHPFDKIATIENATKRLSLSVMAPLSIMLILLCAALSVNNPGAFIYFDF